MVYKRWYLVNQLQPLKVDPYFEREKNTLGGVGNADTARIFKNSAQALNQRYFDIYEIPLIQYG